MITKEIGTEEPDDRIGQVRVCYPEFRITDLIPTFGLSRHFTDF
jgi:hypothetical protein